MRAALCLMLAGPAAAEPPMTAAEFSAYVGTDTIIYGYAIGIIGTADYGPDQTLTWRYEGGACQMGRYYQSGDALCFSIEDEESTPCWHFGRQSGRLHGVTVNLPIVNRIFEIGRSDRPLDCPDIQAGV